MVVLTALLVVNAWQGFFVTWDDVAFGGVDNPDVAPVVALPPGNGPAPPAGTHPGAGPTLNQLAPAVAAAQAAHQRHPADGVMVATALRGARTGYALPARIYFPAAYFDAATPNRTFPVVEFLTGYYGGLDVFQRNMSGNKVMDDLIAKKKLQPTILVIPEQNPHLPADSECVDAVRGDKADTYLSQDVPDVLRAELRVGHQRSSWALMGYSTGGFCAANLALRHPETYSAVIGLAGYFHAITDSSTGDLYKGRKDVKLANTPTHTIGLPRKYPISFYLTSSSGDGEGMRGLKEFTPLIKAPDRLTNLVVGKGGHNMRSWRQALPGAFEWISKTLSVTDNTRG
jgi:enterochelin esterase-like enzyme